MAKLAFVDAVSLEPCGVLVDCRRGISERLRERLGDGELAEAIADEWLRSYLSGPAADYGPSMDEGLREAAGKLGADPGMLQGLSAASSAASWPPFPDSRRGIEMLRGAGYAVFVVSNAGYEALRGAMELAGIGPRDYYEAGRSGSLKPNPRAIFGAYRELGVPIWRGLHASSGVDLDLRPAMVLGLRTAWVNRYGYPEPEGGIAAEYVVGSLEELAEELESGDEGRNLEGWLGGA